jgi:hypothetical protein
MSGYFWNCGLYGNLDIRVTSSAELHLFDCNQALPSSGSQPVLNYQSSSGASDIVINNFAGDIQVANMNNASPNINVHSDGQTRFNVAASCTNYDYIRLVGIGWLEDDAALSEDVSEWIDIADLQAILVDTNEIQGKLPANFIMGSSVTTDKDDEIDAIKAVTDNLPNSGALTDIDTGINNIEAKLPTNFIMGSSDQTDKDDDIDAILVDTADMQPKLGTPIDLGDGATLSGMITGAVSITPNAASFDRLTDSLEAISNRQPDGFKKNTAFSNFHFVMIDETDHLSPKAGLTVTATRLIDDGSFAACANSVVEESNGLYRINLDASDLNGDQITFRFTATGADDRLITIKTDT